MKWFAIQKLGRISLFTAATCHRLLTVTFMDEILIMHFLNLVVQVKEIFNVSSKKNQLSLTFQRSKGLDFA